MRNYPWPASRIDKQLMAGLHLASRRDRPRRPITVLVAAAVRAAVESEFRVEPNNQPQEAA